MQPFYTSLRRSIRNRTSCLVRHLSLETFDYFSGSRHRSFGGGDSPPPSGGTPAPTNDPSVNECKIVEYRGEKVAAFMINGKTMLCLPQAFELFLKVRLDT